MSGWFVNEIYSLSSSNDAKDKNHLRLVTYNIQAWRDSNHDCNFKRIVQVVQELQPDVLCLNEVLHPFANPNNNNNNNHQEYYRKVHAKQGHTIPIPSSLIPSQRSSSFLFQLSQATNLPNVEFCGATDSHYFGQGVEFGNALLTHLPIQTIQHCLLSVQPGDIDLGNQPRDHVEPRAFSAYQLVAGNSHCFGVGVVHLDHKSEELREQQIQRGFRGTSNHLLNANISQLICGDMNTFQKFDCTDEAWDRLLSLYQENQWPLPPEQSLVLNKLKDLGYHDSFYHSNFDYKQRKTLPQATAWTHRPLMRIDHVFYKNAARNYDESSYGSKIRIQNHFRGDLDASDHFPVVVDFQID